MHFGFASSHLTLRVLHVQQPKRERGGRRAIEDLAVESPVKGELEADFDVCFCLGAMVGNLSWIGCDGWLCMTCIYGEFPNYGRQAEGQIDFGVKSLLDMEW